MMYIALTYDHRLIDGREAVLFLKKIKSAVEDPRVLLLDVQRNNDNKNSYIILIMLCMLRMDNCTVLYMQ